MTVSPSMPRLLDLSLPPSSLPSSDSSLYLSPQMPNILKFSSPPSSSSQSGTGFSTLSDLDAIALDADPQIPSSLLPAPPSHISLDISHHEVSRSTQIDLDNASQESTGEYLRRFSANGSLKPSDLYRLQPSLLSETFSLPPFIPPPVPRSFLLEGGSFGSMDWPPIGSSLLPEEGNVRKDEDKVLKRSKSLDRSFGVAKTLILPFQHP